MLSITDYTFEQPKRGYFVITTVDAKYISGGGMIWWKQVGDRVEVISPEDEQYLAKLLHGHEVLQHMKTSSLE